MNILIEQCDVDLLSIKLVHLVSMSDRDPRYETEHLTNEIFEGTSFVKGRRCVLTYGNKSLHPGLIYRRHYRPTP